MDLHLCVALHTRQWVNYVEHRLVSQFCQNSWTRVQYRQSMAWPAYCVFVFQPFLLRLWEYFRVPVTWPIAVSTCIPCVCIKHSVHNPSGTPGTPNNSYTPQNGILCVRCRFMNSGVLYCMLMCMSEKVTPRQVHPEFFTVSGELTLRIHIIHFFLLKGYVVKIIP